MFRSEKLVKITIQTPEQFISSVTGVIARLNLLHLIRIDETHLGRLGYVAETDGVLLKEFEGLIHEIETLLDLINVPHDDVPLNEDVVPEKAIFKIREGLQKIRSVVTTDLGELATAKAGLQEKKTLLERLRILPDALDFSPLNQCHYVQWRIGLIPALGFEKLEESLSGHHHALIELGSLQDRAVIMIAGLKKMGRRSCAGYRARSSSPWNCLQGRRGPWVPQSPTLNPISIDCRKRLTGFPGNSRFTSVNSEPIF